MASGEAGQVVDDHERDFVLAVSAVGEEFQKLGAVSRFRGFSAVYELPDDTVALASTVVAAGLQLRWDAEVLGLFLGGDPAVDDRVAHRIVLEDGGIPPLSRQTLAACRPPP